MQYSTKYNKTRGLKWHISICIVIEINYSALSLVVLLAVCYRTLAVETCINNDAEIRG